MNQPQSPSSLSVLFEKLRFVLVETSHPGNIGAAARAIKTMGFSQLVLVNPRFSDALEHEEAIAFASGALDVLAQARVVGSIEEALEGCNYAAALSARLREYSPPVASPRKLAAELGARTDLVPALIFGSERYGLSNEVIAKCNVLINIPANPAYSSLNLAQAVQLLAYEVRTAVLEEQPLSAGLVGFQGEAASLAQIDGMYAHLEEALIALEFLDPTNPKKLMPRLKRLFSRTGLETEEVNILRGIARLILEKSRK
ncbi:RNA methyltransferase [Noviherbaspirillum galbum]|uniref:tRNA (cytidine/uridine-2'-O-)-methyltransferase TrmJ n=1 Tax=Noviherbaspirillum galbum TaxID=2709383 RepID=A0A6B3SGZ8_9BURK|nr:RNA methyltransferase [Noviherbaspirillum galbum]NEX59903.1 RNA methyltransferase [Noviherbaspirillum galbum]